MYQNLHYDDFSNEEYSVPYIYDSSLIPADRLSIPEVYDVEDGRNIDAREFFSQNENELMLWRRNLEEKYQIGCPRFICPECRQPVKISGHKLRKGRVCYFAHFKDSDDCPYKTGVGRTKEEIESLRYSLVRESNRHKRLKAALHNALNANESIKLGVTGVECDKRINSEIPYLNWRCPDVYAEYKGRKLVFELQLSTTFISVIVERDLFYRLNDYSIIWVFNFDDNQEYLNLYNLMCKDIYYANKRNIFIFDDEAEQKSIEAGQLVLKCRWLDENGKWSADEFVTLDRFQFDAESNKPYIVDADKLYLKKHPEYAEMRKNLEHSREYLLKALMEKKRKEEEAAELRARKIKALQAKLFNNGETVELFRSGGKYGYRHEGVILLPAKYSSAEDIRQDGYAQVGFNRKIGLVRRDGKEIIPPEYKSIEVIDDKYGILLALYKRIDLWLCDEKISLVDEYDESEAQLYTEYDEMKTKHILRKKKYRYYFTRSYYGDHPIRNKTRDGYEDIILFTRQVTGKFCLISLNGTTYLLSEKSNEILKTQYSEIKIVCNDIYAAKDSQTGLWGLTILPETAITGFRFALIVPTDSGDLIVKYADGLFGMIDSHGREYIASKFEKLIRLNSERFAFYEAGLWGICDRYGNILHKAEYTYVKAINSNDIMASISTYHQDKWSLQDFVPFYPDSGESLCILDAEGNISYEEQVYGKYLLRHSGDLYSIHSSDGETLIDYSLEHVSFITDTSAVIKDIKGRYGFFFDGEFRYIDKCVAIDRLCDDIFIFKNIHNHCALGNYEGPLCPYHYNKIESIDSEHFIASEKYGYYYGRDYYYIINAAGEIISDRFDGIGRFENGVAKAIINGKEGLIDPSGKKLEKYIQSYGQMDLYESFGYQFFRNQSGDIVLEDISKIESPYGDYHIIQLASRKVRIYDSKSNLFSDEDFNSVRHLVEDLYLTNIVSGYTNSYRLYRGLTPLFTETFASVILLQNKYIAVQKKTGSGYGIGTTWKIAKLDGTFVSEHEFDRLPEVDPVGFKVYLNGRYGRIDFNGQYIIERSEFTDELILTEVFGAYGLEDKNGRVVIHSEDDINTIRLTGPEHIMVRKGNMCALYGISGKQLTDFKYENIFAESDGCIYAQRQNIKGRLDCAGRELLDTQEFLGGCIRSSFGSYSVLDDNGEVIIPDTLYTRITLLDDNGVFALWKGKKVAVGNIHKDKTDNEYDDVVPIGHGFYMVSITKVRENRSNYYGYFSYYSRPVYDNLYGIIDGSMKTILKCKYTYISKFDDDGKLTIKERKGNKFTLTIDDLQSGTFNPEKLTVGTEYRAKVNGSIPVGIIAYINGKTHIVHKKYLYKQLNSFEKGESFFVRYLGEDDKKHPIWKTAQDKEGLM